MHIVSFLVSLSLVIFGIAPGFGFAGGGGSSSGGGGGGSSYSSSSYSSSSSSSSEDEDPVVTLITIVVITIIIIAALRANKRAIEKENARKKTVNNSTPEEKFIHSEAERIFQQYQADWSALDSAAVAAYATPDYHAHASYMIELLQNLHRVNKVSQIKIHYSYLPVHIDANTHVPTILNIEFKFDGHDEVYDTKSNTRIYNDSATFVKETWNFIYDGKSLKLAGISQPTESAPHLIRSLADFATKNHLYYSPDWGRYAIPKRGLIFGGATMSSSDINNHVIGKWGDLLIQLYSYARIPGAPSTYYIVGQINVPKEYLGVIVKSLKLNSKLKPDKSYEKFEMEWPDFNKRYQVFAASRDALPAFELLNPKFMAYLYDKKLNYNLEVVDNVIYIFAPVQKVTEENYAELLEVLRKAYDELKM